MDMLAKNGLSARDILNGAANAALNLASAAGSDLSPAAAAITDTLQQFKMTTKDLPVIVNQITGAVNQSKLDFVDFQGAAAQAGGVAANVGVQFKDFTATLAGISPLFASGSDAGTSFKTFLTSLGDPSTKAAEEIKRLGLSFYDATGKLRPMSNIAEQLRQKIGGLSDQAKTQSLSTIFGADGIRTALGLMALGSKGLDDIKAKIAETDAAAQSAQRLKGFNGQIEQLKGSIETLAISIGQSGILEAVTGLVTVAGNFIDKLTELSPATLKVATIIAGVTAAIGPFLIALGAIVNAVGTLLPVLIRLGAFFGTTLIPIIASVGRALIGLAVAGGPLTLLAAAATAVFLVWQNWDKIGPIVARMYTAVKTWLVDKLGPIMNWVSDKAKAVGDAFFTLYDRVVGHSYVPDMVDEIGQHMARLQTNMVAPATKATQTAAEAFRALEQQVSPILERLFPRQAAVNRFDAEMAALDAYAKKAGWTADQIEEAHRRMRLVGGGLDPDAVPTGGVTEPTDTNATTISVENTAKTVEDAWARVQAANDNTVTSFADMARDVVGSLGNFAKSIKSGDWVGALQGALDVISQIAGMINGTGAPAQRTYSTNSFGGARAMGGPVLPRRDYLVGERGPEILRMGSSGGSIVPNHEIGGPAMVQIAIEEGALFRPVVRSEAGQVSVQTVANNNRMGALRGRQALGS